MNIFLKKVILLSGFSLLFMACEDKKKGQTVENTPPPPVISVKSPAFNADSAYHFIEKQVSFGPRVPNSQAHRQAGDYLISTLKRLGAEVTVQDFVAEAYNGTKLQSRNIIGSFFPDAPRRILLGAHWDSRHVADKDTVNQNKPIAGANDGGSGVGVLLEIARVLQTTEAKPGVGVDIIFFDSEDYGEPEGSRTELAAQRDNKIYWCLGSQYWSKNKHKPGYSAYYGILLDMVGAKNASFAKEPTSLEYAGSIVNKVWSIAHALGYNQYFLNRTMSGSITDDHTFVNLHAKIPMIDIIDYDSAGKDAFAFYHHTHADDMDIIDKNTLKAVGQTVLQTLYEEGAALTQ